MFIRMLACLAGHLTTHEVGDEVVFPDCAAARLIEAGFAEEVAAKPTRSVEKADKKVIAETR